MKVAAYQAPLLPGGSMKALELIRDPVKWCETERVDILCCPEAVLGGLADDVERPVDIARARDNDVMIVRADVAGRAGDRVSFGSSAIVDAGGTVLRTGRALSEDILVAEVHARAPE